MCSGATDVALQTESFRDQFCARDAVGKIAELVLREGEKNDLISCELTRKRICGRFLI